MGFIFLFSHVSVSSERHRKWSVLDLNSDQCKHFHKIADWIRTRIHLSQHPSFNRHEYAEQACLEWSFLLPCSWSSKSLRDFLRQRLQTSVFNREDGPVLSPFKNLITLLASATSCGNQFHDLITDVIWQSTSFVSFKTAAWNLHWVFFTFCTGEIMNS